MDWQERADNRAEWRAYISQAEFMRATEIPGERAAGPWHVISTTLGIYGAACGTIIAARIDRAWSIPSSDERCLRQGCYSWAAAETP